MCLSQLNCISRWTSDMTSVCFSSEITLCCSFLNDIHCYFTVTVSGKKNYIMKWQGLREIYLLYASGTNTSSPFLSLVHSFLSTPLLFSIEFFFFITASSLEERWDVLPQQQADSLAGLYHYWLSHRGAAADTSSCGCWEGRETPLFGCTVPSLQVW